MTESADRGRAAFDSHDWEAAVEALETGDDLGNLSSDDLLILGDAQYWSGKFDDSVGTLEKAFSKLVAEDKSAEAGQAAALLAYFAARRQAFSVARGWLAQADRLLDGEAETLGHVWLKIMHMGNALFVTSDIDAALEVGDEAFEVAGRVGSLSGQSLALSFKAIAMIHQGDWRDALVMMDEAAIMATAGDDLRMTSDVYCNTISSCRNLGDYKRAGEWTEEAERWMRSNSVGGYTGACQVHRAELKRLHGSWLEAEDQARQACEELERFRLTDYLGGAHYEIGEIRRRMGDLEFAQGAFERAYEQGHDAQPGLSLLMMDRGEQSEAFESIAHALDRLPVDEENPLRRGPSRARLLPTLIEIALQVGKRDVAAEAIEQLNEIATGYESEVWEAAAVSATGSLQIADGQHEQAIEALDQAWRMWQKADLPYEMARARARLGEARRALGDEAGALLELKAALSVLRELGAVTDAERISELLGDDVGLPEHLGARVTRTFMFTDIVTSTDLIGLIGDSSWQELLKWHDRTLQAALERAGGETVRHTGDGFFASFAETRAAVDCAVDIQRQLASHRSESGFAPLVRIGLHRTEATRDGGDYIGGGIHLAARIGDHGTGEQIVVSSSTIDEAGAIPYQVSQPFAVALKGIKEVVELQTIEWR